MRLTVSGNQRAPLDSRIRQPSSSAYPARALLAIPAVFASRLTNPRFQISISNARARSVLLLPHLLALPYGWWSARADFGRV